MERSRHYRRLLVVLGTSVVVLSMFSGVAVAQSGIGGSVTVGPDETRSSVSGMYGTIVVEGTVTGDVSGVAGNVVIREGAVVEGNLDAAAGSITIAGTVRGDVSTGAGSIHLAESGVVNGSFEVGAGNVRIDGTIAGDAEVGAETIRLGETATISGSLTYDGNLVGNRNAVAGDITRDSSIGSSPIGEFDLLGDLVFTVNTFLFNLLLGGLLLWVFPAFSDGVTERVLDDPARSGLVGIGAMVGVPLVLLAVALTLIGIPLALAGLVVFLVAVWVATVYGRFAVGRWLLSKVDVDNRWAALVTGLFVAVVLWQVPIVGALGNLVITLLGMGAMILALVAHRQNRTGESETTDVAGE